VKTGAFHIRWISSPDVDKPRIVSSTSINLLLLLLLTFVSDIRIHDMK
jgi:hypothetical protein